MMLAPRARGLWFDPPTNLKYDDHAVSFEHKVAQIATEWDRSRTFLRASPKKSYIYPISDESGPI